MTNLPSLSPSLPTTNQSKTLLAKLMASENISVEYSPKAQTASFNMETRVLVLPIWKDLNSETLDMLIGHEVSHALHTPAGRDPLVNACNLIDAKNPNNAKSYLNVVEDARIERMIKTKFPGLRRSFASGYRDLLARDLFGIKNQTVSDLPLIDRINLQYKIGWIQNIPFTANELSLAQRVATTISWTDVVKLSKEIYDLARQQKKDKQEQQEQDEASEEGQPTEGADGAESTESNSETGKGKEKSEDTGESTDSDADGEGEQDADSDSDSDDTSNEGNSGKEDQEAKASDDAETGKSGKGEQQQDAQSQNNKTEKAEDADTTPDASQTETAMNSGLDALRDSTLPEIYYADVPTPTDAFVVSLAEVSAALDSHYNRARHIGTTLYASWKRENSAAVQTLAQEFDRRQAADSHKRVSIAETGSIDPNRLHAYRIAEDIFLQNASVRDGKNHGIVVMLDMSGSMREVFHDTMIQLITLGHFCKRVNVPFRFYGFTDQATGFSTKANWIDNSFGLEKNDTRLITLLQDGMRTVDFVRQCGNLLMASYRGIKDTHPSAVAWNGVMNRSGGGDGYQAVAPPPFFHLNNTPTNSALLGMATLLPAFKAAKRLQVVNLVVLTDGEATDSLTSYNYAKQNSAVGGREQSTLVWRDTTTRKTYATALRRHGYIHQHSSQEQTEVVLQLIKDRTGVNTICLRLEGSSSGGSAVRTLMRRSLVVPGADLTSQKMDQDYAFANAAGEKFQDAGWYALGKTQGFDQYIIVKSEYAHDHTSIDSVDMNSKSALRDLRKNFTKMMANKNNNRPLLAQIADILARAAH